MNPLKDLLIAEMQENVWAVVQDMNIDADNWEAEKEDILETVQNTLKSLHFKCKYKIDVAISSDMGYVSPLQQEYKPDEGGFLIENGWILPSGMVLTITVLLL